MGTCNLNALKNSNRVPLCSLTISVLLFFFLAEVSPALALSSLLLFFIFAIPGIWLLSAIRCTSTVDLATIIFGSIIGHAIARIALVLAGLTFSPVEAPIIVTGCATVFSISGAYRLRSRFGLESLDGPDLRWLCILASAFIVTAGAAYAFVGRLTNEGYAFVPYFNHDYLQHIAVTAELAHAIPPQNPFFAGEPLHYYWLYHVWPACLSALNGATAWQAVSATIPFVIWLFLSALILTTRSIPVARARYVAVAIAIFAPSMIGVLALIRAVAPNLIALIPTFNTKSYSLLSHSWLRDALYEPHALSALTLLLCSYYVLNLHPAGFRILNPTLAGALAGCALLTDGFVGGLSILWGAMMTLWIPQRRSTSIIPTFISYLIGAGVCAMLAVSLHMIPVSGESIVIRLHQTALIAPAYLSIELGALFIFGIFGIFVSANGLLKRDHQLTAWVLLAMVSLLFAFGVTVPFDPNTTLRKAVKVLQLPLVLMTAVAITRLIEPRAFRLLRFGAVAIVVMGSTTTFTDVWQHTVGGLRNPNTTYVSQATMEILDWMRRCTPRGAMIQDLSEVRPERGFKDSQNSLIPAFAQRRTLWGNYHHPYIFRIAEKTLQRRQQQLETLFTSQDEASLQHSLTKLRPDYLYVDSSKPGPHRALTGLLEAGRLTKATCQGAVCLIAASEEAKTQGNQCHETL